MSVDAERGRSTVRGAMRRFVLLSVATLVVLGVAIVFESRHIARDEAIRDARVRTAGIASGVAAPLVDRALREGRRPAVAALTRALENRMQDGSVAHIHIWDRSGRVLWSDVPQVVGRRFELAPTVEALFSTGGSVARGSDLDGEEDAGMEEESLLEVYVGAVDADGAPFVFEGYFTPDRIDQDTNAIFAELLPLGLGALLLFQLSMLPLAHSLASRVERGRRQRMELLSRSLAGWHLERRRLAQGLHDGVVQNLSAAGYALPRVLEQLPGDPESVKARAVGEEINALLHHDLTALRSLVMDLFPRELDGSELPRVLQELADGTRASGLRVTVSVPPDLEMSQEVAGVIYRVVREGLRNAASHAQGASGVDVTVATLNGTVTVLVVDDGPGFAPPPSANGHHVGLRLLAGLVGDVGGVMDVRGAESGGTVLEARLPVALTA